MLYERKYIATFSELAHPEHFERVFESVQQAEEHLRSEYDRAAWKEKKTSMEFHASLNQSTR